MSSAAVNSLPPQFLRGIVNDVPAFMPPMSSLSLITSFLSKPSADNTSLPISLATKTPAKKHTPARARAPAPAVPAGATAGAALRANGTSTTPRARAPKGATAPRAKPRGRAPREVLDKEERQALSEYGVDDADSDEERSEEDDVLDSDDKEFIASSSDELVSETSEGEEDDESDESEENDESSGDDGEPEAVSDDYEDCDESDSSEDDAILLELVNEERRSIEHDQQAERELNRLPIGLNMPSLSQRNAYKRYLTPIELVLPMDDNYDACTILNLVRYVVDIAMGHMHSYKQHLNSVEARLHAINETRKRTPLIDGSTESTVLAYKFHLFLAEIIRVAIIEREYSPEATRFAQALLREDLTDGFFVYRLPVLPGTNGSAPIPMSPQRTQRYCAFTGKPANCIVVLRSYITNKTVATLAFDSTSYDGVNAFTFARFWFLPYTVNTYVAEVVEPLWGDARPHNRSAVSAHFDSTCQAELRATVEAFSESIADLFSFVGIEIDPRHKFEFK